MLGNKAAHGQSMDSDTSLYLVGEAYLIGQWFYKTYSGDISSSYSTKKGQVYRVLHAAATDETPSPQVWKRFSEEVRVSNGMGFTVSDIVIPPPLVAELGVQDGQRVSRNAVLNFNKKRQNWCWKAISLVLEGGGRADELL